MDGTKGEPVGFPHLLSKKEIFYEHYINFYGVLLNLRREYKEYEVHSSKIQNFHRNISLVK